MAKNKNKDRDNEEVLSAKAFGKKYGQPLILHFQPKRFRIVKDAARLAEWEAALKNEFGLVIGTIPGTSHTVTDSASLPQSGDNLDSDDCDAVS